MPTKKTNTPRTLGDLRGRLPVVSAEGAIRLDSAVRGLRQANPTSKRQKRLTKSKLSSEEFALRYFPHHFTAPFCEMHRDLFRRIDAPSPADGKREAIIAPRMMGKTTIINLVLPIQKLAYQEKFFVLMIGESADTAEANLATLAHELETNEALLADFPHLRPAVDDRGQTIKWTDRQIVIANFATVRAKGMGARMRGMKHRHMRPDLAILDDPESPETADTFLKRERHKRWFGGTFMGLGAKNWDIYCISNLPHHDCLVANLVRSSMWAGILWRAENIPPREEERYPIGNTRQDGSALWPEVWPLERLERYRNDPNVGALGYAREMMNDPREEEHKAFNIHEFKFVTITPQELDNDYAEMCIAVDPAGGEKPGEVIRGKRDFYVAAVMGRRRKTNYIDVIDVSMSKVLPDKQIEDMLDLYEAYQCPLSIEENMYKNLLEKDIARVGKERALYPRVITRKAISNKVQRILRLQTPIRQGIIRFNITIKEKHPEYFAQFDEFPGTYDDGPDATEGGLQKLEKKPLGRGKHQFSSLTKSSHFRSA